MYDLLLLPPLLKVLLPTKYEVLAILIMFDYFSMTFVCLFLVTNHPNYPGSKNLRWKQPKMTSWNQPRRADKLNVNSQQKLIK